jgi:hypothetical protein
VEDDPDRDLLASIRDFPEAEAHVVRKTKWPQVKRAAPHSEQMLAGSYCRLFNGGDVKQA